MDNVALEPMKQGSHPMGLLSDLRVGKVISQPVGNKAFNSVIVTSLPNPVMYNFFGSTSAESRDKI